MILKLVCSHDHTDHTIISHFVPDPGIPRPSGPLGEPTLVHLATLSEGRNVDFRTIIRKIEEVFSAEWWGLHLWHDLIA